MAHDVHFGGTERRKSKNKNKTKCFLKKLVVMQKIDKNLNPYFTELAQRSLRGTGWGNKLD